MLQNACVSLGHFSHNINYLYDVPVALPLCCDTEKREQEVKK